MYRILYFSSYAAIQVFSTFAATSVSKTGCLACVVLKQTTFYKRLNMVHATARFAVLRLVYATITLIKVKTENIMTVLISLTTF